MDKRFIKLRGLVRRAVVDQDCFGISKNQALNNYAVGIPNARQYAFLRDGEKVDAFMEWLHSTTENEILQAPTGRFFSGTREQWTDKYLQSAYQKGITRARSELIGAGYTVPAFTGTESVTAAFNQPFHADRAGLIYTRAYADLKGVTSQMESQISRVLTQGIIDGKGPRDIARLLNKTISGSGGDLAITDSLGRFIPAQRRAVMIARTEVIRAHHVATIQEYRNWGAAGVKVKAEFKNAGDDRVCDVCLSLEGQIFTLDEIEKMIPVHPQCRCCALPASMTEVEATHNIVPSEGSQVSKKEKDTLGTHYMDSTDPKHIAVQLKGKYAVADIEGMSAVIPSGPVKIANQVGCALDEVYSSLPDLRQRLIKERSLERVYDVKTHLWKKSYVPKAQLNKITLTNKIGSQLGVPSNSVAFYQPLTKEITLMPPSMMRTTPSLSVGIGAHNVGVDFNSVFRHEYGHHIQSVFLTGPKSAMIENTFRAITRSVIQHDISSYAGASSSEMFAELFAVYTSPLYGKPNIKLLPAWAHRLMVATVGPRGTL